MSVHNFAFDLARDAPGAELDENNWEMKSNSRLGRVLRLIFAACTETSFVFENSFPVLFLALFFVMIDGSFLVPNDAESAASFCSCLQSNNMSV